MKSLLMFAVLTAASPAFATVTIADSTKNYSIVGSTTADLRQEMNLKSPVRNVDGNNNKTFDGSTEWFANWSFRWNGYGRTCVINSVAVHLRVTITLPKWENKTAADSATQLKWYQYFEALELHEQGHRRIGIGAAQEIERRLEGLRADCNSINSVANNVAREVVRKYNAIDIEYDKRTDHGATQGAVF